MNSDGKKVVLFTGSGTGAAAWPMGVNNGCGDGIWVLERCGEGERVRG